MSNNRGFTVPFVMLFTLIFLALPVLFWVTFNTSTKPSVKGSSNINTNSLGIKISSKEGTWEVHQYLCTDIDSCKTSLYSGKRHMIVSGDSVESRYFKLEAPSNPLDNKYLKVFVRSGWGSASRSFRSNYTGSVSGIEKVSVEYEKTNYDVMLIPLSLLSSTIVDSVPIEFTE